MVPNAVSANVSRLTPFALGPLATPALHRMRGALPQLAGARESGILSVCISVPEHALHPSGQPCLLARSTSQRADAPCPSSAPTRLCACLRGCPRHLSAALPLPTPAPSLCSAAGQHRAAASRAIGQALIPGAARRGDQGRQAGEVPRAWLHWQSVRLVALKCRASLCKPPAQPRAEAGRASVAHFVVLTPRSDANVGLDMTSDGQPPRANGYVPG